MGEERWQMSAICGVVPRAGESVLVGPSAGPNFPANYWFRVSAVSLSGEPGWIYLDGVDLDTPDPQPHHHRRLFVRIAGLVIRR
jgi:hypothetical protein